MQTVKIKLEASQAVLEWAASYPDVRFCLLEQHLPDGPDHPFARTMLAHFQKLKTPLHTIGTMDQMKQRFVNAQWPEAAVEMHSFQILLQVQYDCRWKSKNRRNARRSDEGKVLGICKIERRFREHK